MFLLLLGSFIVAGIFPSPLFMYISFSFYFIWLYSLGREAHKKNSHQLNMPLSRLQFALIFSAFYTFISNTFFEVIPPWGVPFHLLAMTSIFYSFYFIAKTIRSLELKKTATFEEWAVVSLAIWFFPVGVWFLQKKMNKVLNQ